MRTGAVALLVLVAGCVTATPRSDSTLLRPDSGGFAIDGSPLRIDFGRAPGGVIAALTRELGPARTLPLDGCPDGIEQRLAWGDLVVSFTPEQFVGWRKQDAAAGQTCG
ncbi:hypothetical protein [Rhodovulum euryhalinum]|uniref:Lipoprotein n=1 Tax=Rhodovulum euryhalinum TaxID=35805 RepID=A0A4R2KLK9_9RHOB|nr:hypothetical protein [Rhodovulum euryhalinum]TCO73407.1 hypothetical protein EV655_102172 [Rhodovulum euryhalinum]